MGTDQGPIAGTRRLGWGDRGGQSVVCQGGALSLSHLRDAVARHLPERFGNGTKVHLRFSRWAKSGVWERVFQHLASDADNEYAMIDSTIVRAHQHSAGAKKAGEEQATRPLTRRTEHQDPPPWSTALGNPIGFFLTGGEAHDLVGADHLLPTMAADTLIADKAFDAGERVLEPPAAAGKTAVIPPRTNRPSPRDYDRQLYGARHLIENFFAKDR